MVFKLITATVALAASVSAANINRVTCPDGNVTSNEAVSPISIVSARLDPIDLSLAVLCLLPALG